MTPLEEQVTVTLSREEAKVLLMADHHVECDEKLEALQDSALDKLSAALTQKGDNE